MPISTAALQYSAGDWVSYTDLRYVSSIAVDLRFVYMGTTQGIAVYDRVLGKWSDPVTTGDGLPDRKVEVVGIDRFTGNLLAVSGTTVYSMHRDTESWQAFSIHGAGGGFTSIGVDPEHIWAEGRGWKVRINKTTGGWHPVSSVPPDIEWFGERGEVDLEKGKYSFLAPFYVLDENLERYDYTSAVESEMNLWLGTWGYGAYEYDLLSRSGSHLLMGIAGGRTDALCLDEDSFWFGNGSYESPGITSWRRENGGWKYCSSEKEFGLLSNRVSSIASDSEYVWFATEDGLTRFRKEDEGFKTYTLFDGLPSSEVTTVHVAQESLWVGTSLGICVTGRSSWLPKKFVEPRAWVNDLLVLGDTLWAATEDGVFVMDIPTSKWSEFEDPEGLLAVSTVGLLSDAGKLWFATWRGVLSLDRGTGEWERFTSPVHLPHERTASLAADDENIWIGTVSGVAQFRKTTGDWLKHGQSDGLVGVEVNAIVCDGDYVFFGTDQGVTRFYWNNPFIVR
jgi:ligand-binding sensor domain-containing protein